jgi:PAS domain S-box-containing protein
METTRFEHALLEHTLDIVVVLDASGQFRYANAALERVLGYDPERVEGTNALAFVHPDERPAVVERFRRLVAASDEPDDGLLDPIEFRYRSAAGSWVWLSARMSNEPALGCEEYVVSCRDVTDRRAAECERRRTNERLAHIAEHTHDVLWMFSADWEELLFINSAYEELWGRSIEELRAEPADFLRGIHPSDRDEVQDGMARLSEGEPVDMEYRVNANSGYLTWLWVQGYPITDDDGTVTEIVGFARNVTARKERQRQLLVMDRLLRHNLRNDMNLILGHAEQARDRAGERIQANLDQIQHTGSRLLRTVGKERDIVSLLTTDTDPDRFDLAAAAEEQCGRIREAHPDATLDVSLPAALAVQAVPKFSLAIYELLENAIIHAPDDAPTVSLSVSVDESSVELHVADDGPRIPLQEVRVLQGVRDVRSVYHGSGLGLWLVHWAVKRSGGSLAFESAADVDATADDRRTGSSAREGNVVVVSLDRFE